jgi:hypothetical protein
MGEVAQTPVDGIEAFLGPEKLKEPLRITGGPADDTIFKENDGPGCDGKISENQ